MPEERVQSRCQAVPRAGVGEQRISSAHGVPAQPAGFWARRFRTAFADLLRRALRPRILVLGDGAGVLLVVPALLPRGGRQRASALGRVRGWICQHGLGRADSRRHAVGHGALHHLLGALLAANMAGLAFAAWGARRAWLAADHRGGVGEAEREGASAASGCGGEVQVPKSPKGKRTGGGGGWGAEGRSGPFEGPHDNNRVGSRGRTPKNPALGRARPWSGGSSFLPLLSRVSTQVPPPLMIAALLLASLAAGAAVGIAFRSALVAGTTPAATYVVDCWVRLWPHRWLPRSLCPGSASTRPVRWSRCSLSQPPWFLPLE